METFSRETLDPNYVTGFVDGAGMFTYSRSGKQLSLYFAIKLTALDEPALQQIQDFFGGIGTIYSVKAVTKTARYLRVSRREELMRVVEHFDSYPLRTIKQKSFEIWRAMVLAKQQFRNPDRDLLNEASRINLEFDHAKPTMSVRLSRGGHPTTLDTPNDLGDLVGGTVALARIRVRTRTLGRDLGSANLAEAHQHDKLEALVLLAL